MGCVLLAKKMAKIWLKLQENGEKKSQMAKVMAKEKYILARTLEMHNLTIVGLGFTCEDIFINAPFRL